MSRKKKRKFKAAFLAGLMIGSIVLSFMGFIIFGESMVHTVLNNNKKEYEEAQEDYTVKTRPIYDLQYKEEVAILPSMQVLNGAMGYDEAAVIAALNQILGAYTSERLFQYLGLRNMFRADTILALLPGVISAEIKFNVKATYSLAQAIHEFGWDKSKQGGSPPNHWDAHNAFGIKVGGGKPNDYWDGRGEKWNTHENMGGSRKPMKDDFRVYDSLWHSCMDHGRLLAEEDRYVKANLPSKTTPYDWGYALGVAGYYSTEYESQIRDYANAVQSVYDFNHFEKLEVLVQQVKEVLARQGGGVVTPNGTQVPGGEWAPQNSMGGIQIANTNRITKNYTKGNNRKIEYIVIHDTGNTTKKAKAPQNFNYFNTNTRGASAHYIVDDQQIWQAVDDKDIAHHCGDPKSGNFDRSINCSNRNSIGIEMCVDEGSMLKTTIQKTLYLTKELMFKYNIPLNRVVRHYDVSGKNCPAQFRGDDNQWTLWWRFKRDLGFITGNGSGGGGSTGGSGPIYSGGATGVTGGNSGTAIGSGGGGGNTGEVVQQSGGTGIVANGAGRATMIQNGINYDNLQPARKALLDWAVMQLGKPYVWGAVGPNSFDCSGYTSFVYRNALHIEIPRTSGAQRDFKGFKKIDESQAQPGDLVWHSGHVMLYLKPSGTPGYPWVMEAPGKGKKVRIHMLKPGGKRNEFRQLK